MTVTFPLPVELQGVGRVKGRFVLVSPDTINDPDVYPEARASSGTVTFTPASRLSKTTNYAAVVGHPAKTFPVDSYGVLQDEELSGGVWLREDTYLVSYSLQGMTIIPHSIVVTSAYTDESPLVLSAVIPEPLPAGTTITMLEVPLGASQGQVLGWDNEAGLVWQATAVSDASATVKGVVELATLEETVTGEDAVRATTPAGVKAALDERFTGEGTGTPGANGASAYEVAVTNGFVGTETQWLASLVGPQGDPGADLTHSTPQPINAQTGAYTLVASDAGKMVKMTLAAAADLTVPANVFTAGQRVDLSDRGTARVTVVAGSGMTVNPPAGGSLVMEGQYSAASLYFWSATEADLIGLVAAS